MLKHLVFVLLTGISFTGNLPAQWKLINPLPTNNNLKDMIFVNSRQGAAVGLNGTILITSNGGNSWKTVSFGSFKNLNSIASPDSVSLFICGSNGLIFKTDAGFNRVDTIESGKYGELNKIKFLDQNTGFCLGNDRLILRTTDSGQHWSPSYAGYPCDLIDFSFPDDSVGFICGHYTSPYSATLFRTRNRGITWELVDSLVDDVNAIHFADSLNGFMAGYEILKTTDGGKNWIPVSLHGNYFTDIIFADGRYGWSVNREGYLFNTADSGNTWGEKSKNGYSTRILPWNRDTLFTYGDGGDLWSSHDGGQQWNLYGKGDKHQLKVIEFPDKNTGYILGDSVLYRTSDAGVTWMPENHPVGSIQDASFANSARCLILAYYGAWLSVDACKNWHQVEVPLPKSVFGCAFADDQTAFITGVDYSHFWYDPVMLKSTDGGETWRRDSLPGNPLIAEMYFMPDGDGFALGFSGGLYMTSNAGKTWEQITGTASRFSYRKLFFPSKSTGYAIGIHSEITGATYNEICKTEDSGKSWTSVYLDNGMFGPELTGLYFTSESSGFVSKSDGKILKTGDGGKTWKEDYSTNWLYGIGGTGDNAWAVGYYGTIITNCLNSRISDGTPRPDVLTEMYPVTAISPNPFQDQTDITIMVDQEGPVNITVTDLAGRRAGYFTGDLPVGEFTWTFHGGYLDSGIYLFSVTTGSRTGAARLLKIK